MFVNFLVFLRKLFLSNENLEKAWKNYEADLKSLQKLLKHESTF